MYVTKLKIRARKLQTLTQYKILNSEEKNGVAANIDVNLDLISVHDKREESGSSCEVYNPWARGEKQVFPC